ncbi:MAG: hypothetical protein QJR08_03705 [Bacillota bacterium]|nr:hypothetical protein [Bacillota bacterium]
MTVRRARLPGTREAYYAQGLLHNPPVRLQNLILDMLRDAATV